MYFVGFHPHSLFHPGHHGSSVSLDVPQITTQREFYIPGFINKRGDGDEGLEGKLSSNSSRFPKLFSLGDVDLVQAEIRLQNQEI